MKKLLLIPLLLFFVCSACKKDTVENPTRTTTAIPLPPPTPPTVNIAPRAVAGSDIRITLPEDSSTLTGTYFDTPFDTVQQNWKKISGPNSFVIEKPGSLITKVRSLVKGNYEFELTITDKGGLTGKDTVSIDVFDPPVADSNELIFTNLQWIYPWYATIEVRNILSNISPVKVFIQRDFDTAWIEVKYTSNTTTNDLYEYFIETRPDGAGMYSYKSLYIFYYGNNTTDSPNVKIQF